MSASGHLIGAYGMHWRREEVWGAPDYSPGRSWQMLGRRGQRKPGLRVCDFRQARGFYILHSAYRPTYVGLARGSDGIGHRMNQHHLDTTKIWDRFSWFCFDDVVDADEAQWSRLVSGPDLGGAATTDALIGECESLLITVLGTFEQNQSFMNFQEAKAWEQVLLADTWEHGLLRRVAPEPLKWGWLKEALMDND